MENFLNFGLTQLSNYSWPLYLLTSIFYILSFPGFNLFWLAWVCLMPLIIAIDREKDILSVVRNCLLSGWIIFLGTMYWLTNVTWLGYFLVTFYLACYVALFGIIRFYNKNFITVPLAWAVLEFTRSNLLGGIPWLLLGASQYGFLSLIQIANVTGVYGVSFIVALCNIGIFRGRIFSLLVFILVIIYGKYNLGKTVPFEKIKIGIAQPNVPQDIKWDPEYTDWMLDKLERLSVGIGNADLIVWPETSVPTLTETPGLLERIKGLKINLILGSQGVDEDRRYYNSAFLISEDIVSEYRKIHLVPFGEFIPFGDEFPFLKRLTPIEEGFTAGTEYKVFPGGLAVLICFEDIFPGMARKFVQNGADILINVTNDGWFGKTSAVYQHAYLSVFRAVENGVSLARVTNTGLSCFIEPTGKIHPLKPFVEISEMREVLVSKRNTFYTRYGDVFSWGCIIILLGGLYVTGVKKEVRRD